MKKYPNVTQKLILKNEDKILIFRLADGSYDFPGGQVEWMEGLFESLKRELKEELGLDLSAKPELLHIWNLLLPNRNRHSIIIYYIYIIIDKLESMVSLEGHQVLWLNQSQIKQIIDDNKFVDKIFNYKFNH